MGKRWLCWAGFAAVWTFLLLLPGNDLDVFRDNEFVRSRKVLIAKSVHVAAYAFFAIISAWLSVPVRFRWLLVYFLMLHGTATEMIQHYFVPGRTGTLSDVAFDNLGVTLGMLLSWKWWLRADRPIVNTNHESTKVRKHEKDE